MTCYWSLETLTKNRTKGSQRKLKFLCMSWQETIHCPDMENNENLCDKNVSIRNIKTALIISAETDNQKKLSHVCRKRCSACIVCGFIASIITEIFFAWLLLEKHQS